MLKRIFIIILLFLITFSFLRIIIINKNNFLDKFKVPEISSLYNQSQYAANPELRRLIIQDQDLYAWAGWYYLHTGIIDTINIEHPPLGKYLIGLSILLFNNQNIGQIFWSGLFVCFLFLIGRLVLKNNFFSLIGVLLFLQEKIFVEQLIYSLLDVIIGTFLLISLYLALKTKRLTSPYIIYQGILLGIIASIKYPSIAVILFITISIYYLMKKEKNLLVKLFSLASISTTIFLLSYLPFFINHPSPNAFINLQYKALKIHLSHVPEYPKGQVLKVLLLNQWRIWWGNKDLVKTEYWNFFWPIITLNFLVAFGNFKKNLLLNLWSFNYLLFLCSRLFYPRYLFLLIPFLYLQLLFNLQVFLGNYHNIPVFFRHFLFKSQKGKNS